MSVTAEYELSLALGNLATTIDASNCWRALVAQPEYEWSALKALADAATLPTAVANIQMGPDIGSPAPPVCFVRHIDVGSVTDVSTTGFDVQGAIAMNFEAHAPQTYQDAGDMTSAYLWWTNVCGRIISEMRDAVVASPAGKLVFSGISRNMIGVYSPDEFSDGRWRMAAEFTVQYPGEL